MNAFIEPAVRPPPVPPPATVLAVPEICTFILAVLCSFPPICILLPWEGGLALYAKMVNLHSYACAGTKMENAKPGLPWSVRCALPGDSVCAACPRAHSPDDSAFYASTRGC